MHSQEEIKEILLNILRVGLLRIRAFGSSGLGEACSIEADHLHNLPMLVRSLSREQLLFYFNVERPAFLARAETDTDDFHPLWRDLETHLQAACEVVTKD